MATNPTIEQLQAKIRELEAKQSAPAGPAVDFRIAPRSGQISAYFLGRAFPTTLPADMWLQVLEHQADLRAVIANQKRRAA